MLLIYSAQSSPRLEYIFKTLMNALPLNYRLTTNKEEFQNSLSPRLEYSAEKQFPDAIHVPACGLLLEQGITAQTVDCSSWRGLTTFFPNARGEVSFDLFAASFYLLSRYEEYLPYTADMYGRFAFENSIASRAGFLHLPLINLWLQELKKTLQSKYPALELGNKEFRYMPSYDLDIAWKYRGKGLMKTLGIGLRHLLTAEWGKIIDQAAVLTKRRQDPFDIFDALCTLHRRYGLEAYFFILVAARQSRYDRNASPFNPNFSKLVHSIAFESRTGLHPSWRSGDSFELLLAEKDRLEQITAGRVVASRQHYIRFSLPDSYRNLLQAGISNDFSMGYGSINGFRASYSEPYFWYDLSKEEVTGLLVHPFCWMEANARFEQHLTLSEARAELEHYYNITKQVKGQLITICHNHFLGDSGLFAGWAEMYQQFIETHFGGSYTVSPVNV